jgi:hypothetical protein
MKETWDSYFRRSGRKTALPNTPEFVFYPNSPSTASVPTVEAYTAMKLTIWAPDITFGVQLQCPHCNSADISSMSHTPHARHVQGVDRVELLLQARYLCKQCGSEFQSANDVVMSKLPAFVQEAFPFFLGEKFAVTKQYVFCVLSLHGLHRLLRLIRRAPLVRTSFSALEDQITRSHFEVYHSTKRKYLSHCQLASQQTSLQGPRQFAKFPEYNDEHGWCGHGMNGFCPFPDELICRSADLSRGPF